MIEASDGRGSLQREVGLQLVMNAATAHYLAGDAIDMSALADELRIGRSTLYRLVGNRADLLAAIFSSATERTFARSLRESTEPGGIDRVMDVLARFMRAVVSAEPLQTFSRREPVVFIQLALLPGAVERTASRLVAQLLDDEVTKGNLTLSLPPQAFGDAIVRMCDAHLYAPLLGGAEPEIGTALSLVAALMGSQR